MKDDWRVLRRERGPGGGGSDHRVCWVVWSQGPQQVLLASEGKAGVDSNTEASVWRWSTQVILSPPVAMRRVSFWMTCSFFSAVSEVFGKIVKLTIFSRAFLSRVHTIKISLKIFTQNISKMVAFVQTFKIQSEVFLNVSASMLHRNCYA